MNSALKVITIGGDEASFDIRNLLPSPRMFAAQGQALHTMAIQSGLGCHEQDLVVFLKNHSHQTKNNPKKRSKLKKFT